MPGYYTFNEHVFKILILNSTHLACFVKMWVDLVKSGIGIACFTINIIFVVGIQRVCDLNLTCVNIPTNLLIFFRLFSSSSTLSSTVGGVVKPFVLNITVYDIPHWRSTILTYLNWNKSCMRKSSTLSTSLFMSSSQCLLTSWCKSSSRFEIGFLPLVHIMCCYKFGPGTKLADVISPHLRNVNNDPLHPS